MQAKITKATIQGNYMIIPKGKPIALANLSRKTWQVQGSTVSIS